MQTRRIDWVFLATILLACFAWGMVPAPASGQTYQHIDDCTRMMNTETSALQHQQWELLVSSARSNLTNCLDLLNNDQEASFLWDIGIGLNEQSKFEEAEPILVRCITLKPDAAYCLVELGTSLEGLGRLEDARKAYQRAISIGGYDNVNASAIRLAQGQLANLPPGENLPRTGEDGRSGSPEGTVTKKFGSGFFVSTEGHILTNNHVVDGCKSLATRPDGRPLEVVSRKTSADLALLKADSAPSSVVVFRAGPAPRLGDSVVAFGFPLPGVLSSHGNISTGVLSATSGLQDDVRFIQISAPVQPGNSGGPLFDASGHVIGVVVAKLDAIQIARATGDVPQNVNFAVHWSEIRAFLDEEGVHYRKAPSQREIGTSTVAATATQVAVEIECTQ